MIESLGALPIQPSRKAFLPVEKTPDPVSPLGDSFKLQSETVTSVQPATGVIENQQQYLAEIGKVNTHLPALDSLPDFSSTPFRIGVVTHRKKVGLGIPDGTLYVKNGDDKQVIESLKNATLEIRAEPAGLAIYQNGEKKGVYPGKLLLEDNQQPVEIAGKRYRGSVEILPTPEGTLHAVNTVMLEDYLKGVVPSEMPASWPQESLKAQAVAARTYAVANWGKHQEAGFDLAADVSDQVYQGLVGEHPAATQAVESTAGKVLVFAGKPINALFFSSSGGHTDSALDVWGIDLPYIQGVPDFDQKNPYYRWTTSLSALDIQQALKQLGIDIGEIKGTEVTERTSHQRVKTICFTGTQGSAEVDANRFRFAARLKSTFWTFSSTENGMMLHGGGWGHGLGMSQWGARQMAEDGKNLSEILSHYFTNVSLESLSE